ncbi:MAG TPA: glycerate kinase [Microlunatus sp.]
MRLLICPDRMGPLSSAEAGRVMAAGWPGASTLAVGEAGFGFVEAIADGWDATLHSAVLDGTPVEWAVSQDAVLGVRGASSTVATGTPIPYAASSTVVGEAVATLLRQHRPRRLLVDLAGVDVHDAGAGLLSALGAESEGGSLTAGPAGLAGLRGVRLDRLRALLSETELVGVVPTEQRHDALLGLRGITSRRGRAVSEDAAVLLATDAAVQQLTGLVAPEQALVPGAGACGGLGWAVLALGGRLSTGPELCLAAAPASCDLVVTGCAVFDFATRGGGVVAAAAEVASTRLAPCIVIAGEVLVGAREMRTMGIEAAYAIRTSSLDAPTGGDLSADEVARAAVRVARSWHW